MLLQLFIYFFRLIHVFQTVSYDSSLVDTLDTLAYLNKINQSVDGLKVPYDTFHISDLHDYLDVRIDYVLWLTDKNVSGKINQVNSCLLHRNELS